VVSADSYRGHDHAGIALRRHENALRLRPPDFQPPRAAGHLAWRRASRVLSEVDYYPDSGLSIVVLLNTAGPVGPGELARDIADVVLGKVTEPSNTYSGDLSAFAGTFEGVGRGRPTVVTFAVEGGKLMMKGTGPEPRALAFQNGETFAAGDALVTFERDGGRVTRLHLDTGGGGTSC
jgi:hypothetical protein